MFIYEDVYLYRQEVNEKMAWRPTRYLICGELDNRVPGKVTGWMKFAGKERKVVFDLKGNFHRDIRGATIRFKGKASGDETDACAYMQGFSCHQDGKTGDMTAGLPPADYISGFCYLEWYSEDNGRVVIELGQNQVEVIGTPLPVAECEPISRKEQHQNMAEFLVGIAEKFSSRK